MRAKMNAHVHTCTRVSATCATSSRLRHSRSRCKLVSDKVRFYLGTLTFMRVERGCVRETERGRGRGTVNKRNGRRGNAWAIFCLAMLYHDYISRLIRSLCGPTIAPPHTAPSTTPVPQLVGDQEVPSLLPEASRRDINVEWNKLRDSEFVGRDLVTRWNC